MYYIAFDVSKKVLCGFDGEKELAFDNKKGLKALKSYLKKKYKDLNDLVIVFEATGVYSNYLKAFCADNNLKVYIINPKRSSNFSKAIGNRSKTDKIDTKQTIYEYRKIIGPKDIKVPKIDQVAQTLSAYLTSYKFTVKKRVSISNHLEALERNTSSLELVALLKGELKQTKKTEEKIKAKIEEYIKKDSQLNEDYKRQMTIPGVGKVSAICLLTLFNQYKDTNQAQITALVGLDPTKRESGTSVKGKMKISKNGDRMIRGTLYFPLLSAIRFNKKIKALYDRLLANHKPKQVALIAAMRKLILISHAIYKNKTVYSAV